MSFIDDLKAASQNLSTEVVAGVEATKTFVTGQFQANAERIEALQQVSSTALAHAEILKAENAKLQAFNDGLALKSGHVFTATDVVHNDTVHVDP